jgi:hypothetical protein
VSLTVYVAEVPVLYERLLPDSQVTFPEASFLMCLYSKPVLPGTVTVDDRIGYPAADSLIAFAVFQPPSAAFEPTTYTSVPVEVPAQPPAVAPVPNRLVRW